MFWDPVSQACQADTHWLKKLTKYSPSNVQMIFCFCFARMSTLKMAASYISRPVQSRFLIGYICHNVMPSNDRPVASQSDVAEILSKRFRFKCDLQKGARSLKM